MKVYSLSNQNQRLNVAFIAKITINVDGQEFKLTKIGQDQQGKSGATYKVDGQAAFAKTNFKAGPMTNEANVTKLV